MTNPYYDSTWSLRFRETAETYSRAILKLDGKVVTDTFYNADVAFLLDGSVDQDRTRDIRGTARLEFLILDEDLLVALSPARKAEVELFSGMEWEGSIFWAPLGRYMVSDGDIMEYENEWVVNILAMDRSVLTRDNMWSAPFQTGGGTYQAAMEDILDDRLPAGEFYMWVDTYTRVNAPSLHYTESDDPWAALLDLASSSEKEIYYAKNGLLTITNVPDASTEDAQYVFGERSVLVHTDTKRRSFSRSDIYNGVICKGTAPWLLFPVSGEYWDDNPASPTYRATFGDKPKVIESAVAVDDTQCAEIAEAEFKKIGGISEEATFEMLKDPYLEAGMVCQVAGEQTKFTIDYVRYPLGSGVMSGTIRRKL